MAKKQRVRERRPYRDPAAARGAPAGGRSRRTTRTTENAGLPLLPITIGGLALGILAVAFVALSNSAPPPSTSTLATPDAVYPAENADMSLGSADAPVQLDLWADFQCPACRAFTRNVEPRAVETYVKPDKLRVVFHDFAFIGPESIAAATAARCAGGQHHFWEFNGYLYANQGRENSGIFTQAFFDQVARALALDVNVFDACISGGTARAAVVASTNEAIQKQIPQTPTLYIGSQPPINGSPTWETFKAVVDAELAKSQ